MPRTARIRLTLTSGITDIVLKGAASDYTETYDGVNTLTISNTGNKDGTGTKVLHLTGGSGQLEFGDGTTMGVGGGATTATVQYGGNNATMTGTAGADMLYTGKGSTVNGNGGARTRTCSARGRRGHHQQRHGEQPHAAGRWISWERWSDEILWFAKSGNNLVVDVLGTKDQVTLKNVYAAGDTYAQVSSFSAGGLTLDTQLATLVQAMATYSAGHGAFNPQTSGTAMPADATVQAAITAAWHH